MENFPFLMLHAGVEVLQEVLRVLAFTGQRTGL
jgi:hypothetical protein